MSSSFKAKRIRIKFHNNPMLTEIFDADTGEPIYDVTCLELKLDITTGHYGVQLIADSVMDPDLQGEVVADVNKVTYLSDAALDVLAHKVERLLAARHRYGIPFEEEVVGEV